MARRGRRTEGANIWPGFVDGLSTLLLVMMFVLSIFLVAQVYLGKELEGKNQEIRTLSDELASLAAQLGLLESQNTQLKSRVALLESTIAEKDETIASLRGTIAQKDAEIATLGTAIAASAEELEKEKALTEDQKSEIATLNAQLAALRDQLRSLQEALEAAEAKDKAQEAQIENLSERLNAALARKVQELQEVRSRFFEALREALGDRDDVKVVGDRFIFESDILFGSCSDEIAEAGKTELAKLADVLLDIRDDIPSEIAWVIRVDGHADALPLSAACRAKFRTNWHLSTARAVAVVRFLADEGVPDNRLMAAGFGENQPLVQGFTTGVYAQNRRIEFKLTER